MSTTDPYYMTGYMRSTPNGVNVADNTLLKTDGNGLTMQGTDITISDAEVMTFPTGGEVHVDTITDAAGTGAPAFSQGLTVAASKNVTLGASGIVKADTVTDRAGTGAVALSMGATVAASKSLTLSGYLSLGSPVAAGALASGILTLPAGGSFVQFADATANCDGILAASSVVGRVLVLIAPSSGTITLRDGQSVGSDKAFGLGGATRALAAGSAACVVIYDGTLWRELGFAANT
jgi:hypothetical protein